MAFVYTHQDPLKRIKVPEPLHMHGRNQLYKSKPLPTETAMYGLGLSKIQLFE